MKLIWHGHACFTWETNEGTVVLDPFAPEYVPGLALPPLQADLVLCSHGHADHNYAQAVRLTGEAPGLRWYAVDCFHDEENGSKRGENRIHVIEAEGLRLAHLGDLGHMLSEEQLAALGQLDVLLLPVGGFYTLDAAAAHALAAQIGARITIPMHFRGTGFGYDVLGTVEEYARLADTVQWLDSNTLEFPQAGEPCTCILRCPVS